MVVGSEVFLAEVQEKYTHKYSDDSNSGSKCFEKKVLSGDNKTEKNSYYGIIR